MGRGSNDILFGEAVIRPAARIWWKGAEAIWRPPAGVSPTEACEDLAVRIVEAHDHDERVGGPLQWRVESTDGRFEGLRRAERTELHES